MKNRIINNLMDIIKKYNNFDDIKLQEIKYGLETIYLTIIKTIVFIIISIILSTLKELLLFMLFYGILRLTGFGVHAKKSIHCWISSFITFILIPIFIKYLQLNNIIISILLFISILLLIIYAPADTPKRPLINKKKRIIYKVLTIFVAATYTILIIIKPTNLITNSMIYSLLLEGFLVTPLSYKLFGVSYKNYKNYKRKEKKKWNYLLH